MGDRDAAVHDVSDLNCAVLVDSNARHSDLVGREEETRKARVARSAWLKSNDAFLRAKTAKHEHESASRWNFSSGYWPNPEDDVDQNQEVKLEDDIDSDSGEWGFLFWVCKTDIRR